MKKYLFFAFFVGIFSTADAQLYFTKSGKIHFYSKTAVEAIEASNNTVNIALDAATGKVEFGVTIKGFKFEKALMEQHFNENYLESSKFPKATFKGQFDNFSSVDFAKDGTYDVTATGKMTIHGVTKDVSVPGKIIIKGGNPTLQAKFNVVFTDYNIVIPAVVKESFEKHMPVDVNATLTKK
jgi:polyisoprenoid-binding protein YceI